MLLSSAGCYRAGANPHMSMSYLKSKLVQQFGTLKYGDLQIPTWFKWGQQIAAHPLQLTEPYSGNTFCFSLSGSTVQPFPFLMAGPPPDHAAGSQGKLLILERGWGLPCLPSVQHCSVVHAMTLMYSRKQTSQGNPYILEVRDSWFILDFFLS